MIPILHSRHRAPPAQFSRYIDEVGDGDLHVRLRESQWIETQLDLPRLPRSPRTPTRRGNGR